MMLHPFKIGRIAGILLILVAILLLFVNPKPENNLPAGFFTPIIALEFIQTSQEVQHFFDVPNSNNYEQGFLLGNKIDYVFMCLYSSLLCCIALGIRQVSKTSTMYLAILLCISMLTFDILENLQLSKVIQHYKMGDISENLNLLNIFTWLKWGSIASVFLLFSPFFLRGKTFHKIIGSLCVLCFGLCIAAFVHRGILNEIFSTCVVLLFLMMVIFVFTFKDRKLSNL